MFNVGMYGGSFNPLHLGHVNDIINAANICEKLYVVLSITNNPEEIDCFRQKLYLIMGCAVGNTAYGPKYDPEVDGTEFDYAVDYVRLYQIPYRDELVYGFKG